MDGGNVLGRHRIRDVKQSLFGKGKKIVAVSAPHIEEVKDAPNPWNGVCLPWVSTQT